MIEDFERESDVLDIASAIETREREAMLARARNHPSMPAVGACYNCGEGIGPRLLFCDRDCRDDFQKRHPEPL